MQFGSAPISLAAFLALVARPEPLTITAAQRARLVADRQAVERYASGPDPVYGLNTGLGANLGHRLSPAEITAFQDQIIAGRTVAVGPDLPPDVGRATLLARIVSARLGGSGMAPALFDHLCAVFSSGLAPAIPQWGSIGASDLTQNAAMAAAVLGRGRFCAGSLAQHGLTAPVLGPKDAMALINHSGATVAQTALAMGRAGQALAVAKSVIVLTYQGFGANSSVLAAEVNSLRHSPGQAAAAAWFRLALQGADQQPRRIQEALSLRTIAPVIGAAESSLAQAVQVLEAELNGLSDSPAILADGSMHSTANFHTPALALALESLSQALAMVGSGSLQRLQRLMNPELSGLPRYLSPVGGASAGMVPIQKTAAALLADIRHSALPVIFDAAPVSDTVEDVAPMTPLAARKLDRQTVPFRLLIAIEALAAAQAVDLRQPATLSPMATALHRRIRSVSCHLTEDRPLGPEVELIAAALEAAAEMTPS